MPNRLPFSHGASVRQWYKSHLVAGKRASLGGGVVLLARLVVEDAHDHQRVGAREARAPLVLLSGRRPCVARVRSDPIILPVFPSIPRVHPRGFVRPSAKPSYHHGSIDGVMTDKHIEQ